MLLYAEQIPLFAPTEPVSPARPVLVRKNPPPQTQPETLVAGICRFCGCHVDSCCSRSGDRCDWTDETRTSCTAEPCMAKLKLKFHQPEPITLVPPPAKPKPKRYYSGSCSCSVCSGRDTGRCSRLARAIASR